MLKPPKPPTVHATDYSIKILSIVHSVACTTSNIYQNLSQEGDHLPDGSPDVADTPPSVQPAGGNN